MWLFTKYGFYSIANKKYGDQVKPFQIRARRRKDLQNLKDHLRIEEEIVDTPQADYACRLVIDEMEFRSILLFLAENIDYENFKRSIHDKHDQNDKVNYYNQVWKTMYNYQHENS